MRLKLRNLSYRDELEVYKVFRDRITFEDQLISMRTNWLIWTQTSLLGALLGVYFESRLEIDYQLLSQRFIDYILLVLPGIGMLISMIFLALFLQVDKK